MFKKGFHIICLFVMAGVLATGCSTKKNTWASRSYHYTKAKYNVLFNGRQAFDKGVKAVWEANKDNYGEVLPLDAISNHDNASAATSNMDRAIEKSQKAIKTHSIVKKPKKKASKARDPKYQEFMKKEEYNPEVQQAWLLMGKAQFYQLDFLAANATFTYAIRHYADNKDVFTEANLWMARSYAEMGWFYEAEDVLGKMNEKTFSAKTNAEFVLVKADLLLKQRNYAEAVPFLKTAISQSKRSQKARREFILAQCYQRMGKIAEAYEWYAAAAKDNPSHQLEFNARLGQAQCYQGSDTKKVLADLRRLTKKQSNADYLDQIYFAIAEVYRRAGDEDAAVENYQKAIESSTRDGIDKAEALLALGEIYYNRGKYIQAQPLYNEAVMIIPQSYPDYKKLESRAINLNDVAKHQSAILLEDSLQHLASLPEKEREEQIKAVIAREKKEKEEEARRLEEQARIQEIREQNAVMGQTGLSTGEAAGTWYFYNNSLISKGKLEFQRQWGKRVLEDDWRRRNKMSVSFDVEEDFLAEEEGDSEEDSDEQKPLSRPDDDDEEGLLKYYMRMLPMTEAKVEASNATIRESLYQLFVIFEGRIQDYEAARKAFDELRRRFPDFEQTDEMWYRLYKMYQRADQPLEAELAKEGLEREYPDSKWLRAINNPESVSEAALSEQETLYRATYAAFLKGDGYVVRTNTAQAQAKYPDSDLIPKFRFLEALSSGKAEGQEAFKEKLNALVADYPDNEIAPLAKDMVALMEQGKEVQSEASYGAITEERQQVVTEAQFAENLEKAGFVYEPEAEHHFVLYLTAGEDIKNKVLFVVATYNFTRFLIKDFDLSVRKLDDGHFVIAVSGLTNLDEAVWYQHALLGDSEVLKALEGVNYKGFAVSKNNYKAVFDRESMEKYLEFYQANSLEINESEVKELEDNSGFVKQQEETSIQ